MNLHDATAMPPLLVRASPNGEYVPDMLLAPWMPLSRPLEGRMWCDGHNPADGRFGNHVDFPTGCGPAQAIETVLLRWQGKPDPIAAWFDGDQAIPGPIPARPTSMTRDANGVPVPPATLADVPVGSGRVFRICGEPGATLLLDDVASSGTPRTLVARDGFLACLRRSRYARPEWTVVPDLGPVGTYWTFANHNVFSAMCAVAIHLAERHAEDEPPDDILAVLAHAVLRLRQLGPDFRDRVVRILSRCRTDDLDVLALTWCLVLNGTGRDELPDPSSRVCEMLPTLYPIYTATLECLCDGMARAVRGGGVEGGADAGALGKAAEAVGRLANLYLEGHATLVLGHDR